MLAGRRGPRDALAEAHGVSHRALLPVDGVPMLLRVLRALQEGGIERLHVSSDAPEALRALDDVPALLRDDRLRLHPAEASPSRSVLAVLAQQPEEPFLVTSADHALLTPDMVRHFGADAERSDADLAIGFVAASRLRAAFPDVQRTYLRLRGESWSGANLFAFRTARAREAARFWVRAERHRNPGRPHN